jgi:hypothetical protein
MTPVEILYHRRIAVLEHAQRTAPYGPMAPTQDVRVLLTSTLHRVSDRVAQPISSTPRPDPASSAGPAVRAEVPG